MSTKSCVQHDLHCFVDGHALNAVKKCVEIVTRCEAHHAGQKFEDGESGRLEQCPKPSHNAMD